MLDMEYFSMMAVRRSRENFCSRQSWPADWLLICSEEASGLRGSDVLKLGHRSLGGGRGTGQGRDRAREREGERGVNTTTER